MGIHNAVAENVFIEVPPDDVYWDSEIPISIASTYLPFEADAGGKPDDQRQVFQALTRAMRLQRNCPFPREDDLV